MEWVVENFIIEDYGTSEELILDIEQRFWQDGMYFPIEAKENINNVWQARVGIGQREPAIIADFLAPPTAFEPEIMEIQEEFYATLPEPGEALETREEAPIVQPVRTRILNRFRNIGRRFSKFFGLGK